MEKKKRKPFKTESFNKIAVACDHAGADIKPKVIAYLHSLNYQVIDCGAMSAESSDYPDYAHKVARLVAHQKVGRGVLICGSGIGMAMTANRYKGVRAFVCDNPDIAALARQHNDANVICFGMRLISLDTLTACLDTFLKTQFEGGRHERRVNKIEEVDHDA